MFRVLATTPRPARPPAPPRSGRPPPHPPAPRTAPRRRRTLPHHPAAGSAFPPPPGGGRSLAGAGRGRGGGACWAGRERRQVRTAPLPLTQTLCRAPQRTPRGQAGRFGRCSVVVTVPAGALLCHSCAAPPPLPPPRLFCALRSAPRPPAAALPHTRAVAVARGTGKRVLSRAGDHDLAINVRQQDSKDCLWDMGLG